MVIGKVEGDYTNVYSVDTDNYRDSITLTNALIESGHRNIACLHAPLDVHVSIDRVNGYKASLQAHNIKMRDEWVIDGGILMKPPYLLLENYLVSNRYPMPYLRQTA